MPECDWAPLICQLPPTIRDWFVAAVQHCASEHEMSAPVIDLTNCHVYKDRVAADIMGMAVAANLEGTADISICELDRWCGLAAEDIVRIRIIGQEYKNGRFALEALQRLPLYETRSGRCGRPMH